MVDHASRQRLGLSARVFAALLALLLVATACNTRSQTGERTAPTTPAVVDPGAPAPDTAGGASTESNGTDTDNQVATPVATPSGLESCPNPIVIQTDWYPEPEYGAVYNLTAGAGSIDPQNGRFTGPLAAAPFLDVEIRSGGPYIGSQPTSTLMATDDDIFLGFINTDEAVAFSADIPTTAVMAHLEINPQIIMWDPDSYTIGSWDDVAETGAVLNHYAGAPYAEWLAGTGLISAENLDPSYDGSPARFIAEDGAVLQQGFASLEPWQYENIFDEWGRPIDFLLIHDAGYPIYPGALSILTRNLDEPAESCLEELIPLVQQSAIDYRSNPDATNAAILQATEDLNSAWILNATGMANSNSMMIELGLTGNGPDQTVGNFDLDRVNKVIDAIDSSVPSIDVPEGLAAEDLVTNEFIDPSIGF